MGLSSPEGAPSGGGASHEMGHASAPTSPHQNFGQIFSHILEQKYPIAGGLAHMVFGGGPSQTPSSPSALPGYGSMATAPLPQMPTGETQQPDMISANAKPPSGGGSGLASLLSLFL